MANSDDCFETSVLAASANVANNSSALSAPPHGSASDFMPMLEGSKGGSSNAFTCHSRGSLDCGHCCRGAVAQFWGLTKGLSERRIQIEVHAQTETSRCTTDRRHRPPRTMASRTWQFVHPWRSYLRCAGNRAHLGDCRPRCSISQAQVAKQDWSVWR
jgi:hypothetical protein